VYGGGHDREHLELLKLAGTTVWIDVPEYCIDRAGKILGILDSIVRG
jgi:hypothetical protein